MNLFRRTAGVKEKRNNMKILSDEGQENRDKKQDVLQTYTWAHLGRCGLWCIIGMCWLCVCACGYLALIRDESFMYLVIVLISLLVTAGCCVTVYVCYRKLRQAGCLRERGSSAAADQAGLSGRFREIEERAAQAAGEQDLPLPRFGKKIAAALAVPCLIILAVTAVTARRAPALRAQHKAAVSEALIEMTEVFYDQLLAAETDSIEKNAPYRAMGYVSEDHKSYICVNLNWEGDNYSIVYRTSVLCAEDKADTLEQCEAMIREMYAVIQDLGCVNPAFKTVYPVDDAFRELFLSDERYYNTHGKFVSEGPDSASCDVDFTYYGPSKDGSNNATLICTVKAVNS